MKQSPTRTDDSVEHAPHLGGVIIRFEGVSSTNDIAKKLAEQGAPEGTVVVARTQKHGRGRGEKTWSSPAGGLWFSLVLRPEVAMSTISLLSLAAGIAVAKTIRRLFPIRAMLKWPNDVTINGRKVAGILVEMSTEGSFCYAILGFGINVNNSVDSMEAELGSEATSIVDQLNSNVNVDWLMREIINEFSAIYAKILACDSSTVVAEWKRLSDMLKKTIIIQVEKKSYTAAVLDLDSNGALVIQSQDGTIQRLHSGDVSIREIGSHTQRISLDQTTL